MNLDALQRENMLQIDSLRLFFPYRFRLRLRSLADDRMEGRSTGCTAVRMECSPCKQIKEQVNK